MHGFVLLFLGDASQRSFVCNEDEIAFGEGVKIGEEGPNKSARVRWAEGNCWDLREAML